MDIPKLSMDMAGAKLSQSIQISVLKNVMEQTEQTGAQIVEMMNTLDVPKDYTLDIKA